MKTIFIIFLLISTSTITSSTATLDKQQSDFIDLINVVRRKVAKYYNIINMHKLYWDEGLQKFVVESNESALIGKCKIIPCVPVRSMDQKGINALEKGIEKYKRVCMYPWQTTVACVKISLFTNHDFTCFFGPEPSATTVNPNNNSNVLPISEAPETQTHHQTNHSTPTNLNPTPPRPKNPESSSSRKTKLSPETATLPKELEDYVEVDGDDYDEDFPTGEPLLDSGFKNFLQFWITVVFVLGFCLLI
ncbi:Protein CBG27291 [Caenorhabditis briggsae]|uniref:Protein CBG27291 n=1 Tax=Caenorhabditis briggsae TaxID=6238 RepID=B6IM68_CAEBR|nr:Protein CBG27291 [Caenorhabditis briggsae]CAS00998.1 Protein CBG27291 [Caenorhabditis briggsae]